MFSIEIWRKLIFYQIVHFVEDKLFIESLILWI